MDKKMKKEEQTDKISPRPQKVIREKSWEDVSKGEHLLPITSPSGNTPRPKRDRTSFPKIFMKTAILAAERAEDRDSRVGCVIVNKQCQILALGFNGDPKGKGLPEDLRGKGKDLVVHAEMNAVAHANCNLQKEEIYVFVTRMPCKMCMKMLCQYNILGIFFGYHPYLDIDYLETMELAKSKNCPVVYYPFGDMSPEEMDEGLFQCEDREIHRAALESAPKCDLTKELEGGDDFDFEKKKVKLNSEKVKELLLSKKYQDLRISEDVLELNVVTKASVSAARWSMWVTDLKPFPKV